MFLLKMIEVGGIADRDDPSPAARDIVIKLGTEPDADENERRNLMYLASKRRVPLVPSAIARPSDATG